MTLTDGVNGKKGYDRAFHLVNKFWTEKHHLSGNFCYENFKLTVLYIYMHVQLPTAIAETNIEDKLSEKTTILEEIELGLFTGSEDAFLLIL